MLLTKFSEYVESFATRFGVPVLGTGLPIQSATHEDLTILTFGMGSAMAATVMELRDSAAYLKHLRFEELP